MSEPTAPKQGEYEQGRLWFHRKGNIVTVGLTTAAIDEVGVIESIELPDDGDDFSQGEAVCTCEGSKGSLEVTAPASGFIEEVNTVAKDEVEVVTEDPLEEGWLFKIQIEDPTELQNIVGDED